jgi:GT2 family glycosyltransferase/glycosyltransferase involved in cell wall biosynthesis
VASTKGNSQLKEAGLTSVSRRVQESLAAARVALDRGDPIEAARILDRAWRTAPNVPALAELGPAYGKILLDSGLYPAALAVLDLAEKSGAHPETTGLIILALAASGRLAEAEKVLTAGLHQYCVPSQSTLQRAADMLVLQTGALGWVGYAADLSLTGRLRDQANSGNPKVEIRDADGRKIAQQIARHAGDGWAEFSLALPALPADAPLTVLSAGSALLGSGILPLPARRIDGRSRVEGRFVVGWFRPEWDPDSRPAARIADSHGRVVALKTRPGPAFRQEFRLPLLGSGLRGNEFVVSVRLPGGVWTALPDSPALRLAPVRPLPKRRLPRLPRRRDVDVIIPAYADADETLQCIHSVLSGVRTWKELIVVNDCSPEPRLLTALRAMARRGQIKLLDNETNLGFSASVNRGLALHPDRDAVVLNSDTRVFGNWLARLRTAAYKTSDTGSVTPMTSDGTVVSYPHYKARALSTSEAAALDGLAARANRGKTSPLPVAVGFCMYLRRDCLDAAGNLDADTFGKGYGEEVDLCLRAEALGWRHVMAGDVFVQHTGGRSFGARREALQERAQVLLNLRYPGYAKRVAAFDAEDPGHALRRNIAELQISQLREQYTLIVSQNAVGGVARFVEERVKSLRQRGLSVVQLRPGRAGHSECVLDPDNPAIEPLRYSVPGELPRMLKVLSKLKLGHIELHHFRGLPPAVIEALDELRAPRDVYLHDYVWLCPQITLIDQSIRYCGEPPLSTCEKCVKKNGSSLGEAITVQNLRRRSARWLQGARRVIAPSRDTASRFQRYFPRVRIDVEPHQIEFPTFAVPTSNTKRTRVALIGAIGNHKGYQVLLDCALDAARRSLPLEFTVIGYSHDDARLLKTGRVFITGRYFDIEVPNLIRRERPSVILLPSVWPETWSYTLSHAIASGLPVVSFDLGAIAERLRQLDKGHLLPLATSAARLNDRLLELAAIRETESLAEAYRKLVHNVAKTSVV